MALRDGKCKLLSSSILLLLLITRIVIQPYYSLISDCDETFNYWEPLNLLVRGFGKQTWEYSPEYSIRSWAFLLPLYGILKPLNQVIDSKVFLFYTARALLGFVSFLFEYSLSKEISSVMSLHVSIMWLLFQLFNPGWFHASVEFLPSAFAMITTLGYMKYTLRYLSTGNELPFVKSISFVFLGGILGWPFSLILVVTNVIHYAATHRFIDTLRAGVSSSFVFAIISSIVTAIDSFFYGKLSVVPFNIVMYNIISANEDSGPNIFGVEPWYYYIQNLLLNFPITTLSFGVIGFTQLSIWPLSGSLFIWLNVFLAQPHKEERFLYPVYGIITLLAAVGLFNITVSIRWKKLRKLVRGIVFFVTLLQAASRILALTNNYTSPIQVYSHLPESTENKVVCTGREWYHFPTSLLLPDNYRLQFVQSGFDGLLPGDFLETGTLNEKIRSLPNGMNNRNIFDPSKVVNIDSCDYYVDINVSSNNENDVVNPADTTAWEPLYCLPFVDTSSSKFLGRSFQVPAQLIAILPTPIRQIIKKYYDVQFIDYCTFVRRHESDSLV
ncbi:Alg9 [Kluyveromyces lactis]|nr:Alg9 [Kluyveromyces lactis]